jgi:hypothetical protein
LKCISAIGAVLKHTAIKAEVRVCIRRFKVEVVPETQLRDVTLENSQIRRA